MLREAAGNSKDAGADEGELFVTRAVLQTLAVGQPGRDAVAMESRKQMVRRLERSYMPAQTRSGTVRRATPHSCSRHPIWRIKRPVLSIWRINSPVLSSLNSLLCDGGWTEQREMRSGANDTGRDL